MSQNILKYLLIVIVCGAAIQGSAVEVPTTDAPRSWDTVRQRKSQEILKYLNTTVDPCDDFFEFTCGNYGKYHEDKLKSFESWNELYKLVFIMEDRIQEVLRTQDSSDLEAVQKVKKFYKSCLNSPLKTRVSYGNRIKEFLKEFGEMPALMNEQWHKSDFDWVQLVGEIKHATDIAIILNVNIAPDFTNNSINRGSIIQPSLYYDQANMYKEEKYRMGLKEIMFTDLHEVLGLEREKAQQIAEEISELEIALSQGMQDVELTAPTDFYDVSSLDKLQEKYSPHWDTKKLLSTALDLSPSQVMVQPFYLQNAAKVMQKTPLQTVANYIFYTYLVEYMKQLPEEDSPMEYHCTQMTRKYFDEILQNMVYRKYFSQQDKAGVLLMWQELRSTFKVLLKSSPSLQWMRADTRQKAMQKLNSMKLHINTYEDIDFNVKYSQLKLKDDDLMGNIYAILALRANQTREKMNQAAQFKVPPSFSPSYTVEQNAVHIPLYLLLRHTAWSPSYPNSYNFASLGFYLAHEMFHGFDDVGLYYDGSGNSKDWWDSDSLHEFTDRTQCLANQYKSYVYGQAALPDIERQAENISDNAGLRLAFAAYTSWYDKASSELQRMEQFPDLNYTRNQIFFISYTHAMCSAASSIYNLTSDIHYPHKFRIIGTLSNFAEFAKEFNCPKRSPMNPAKKCEMY